MAADEVNKRSLAVYLGSRAFMVAAGQDPLDARGTFLVHSKSRNGAGYEMLHTPDGYAVHQGEGCEGEQFNGPTACWHSKDYSVSREDIENMTSLTPYQGGAVTAARQYSDSDIATLKQTICKGASDAELKLFVATCQHTGLDPFMRQIHAVQRRTQENGQWVQTMTIQIGIDGFRLIAERTGEMQGMDGPQWTADGVTWLDLWMDDANPPYAARCAIWRKGIERPYVAVCRWGAYVQTVSGGGPNAMWRRMGPEMLAKCAEALALRRAFPAEMASLPARPDFIDAEEVDMERQNWTPSPDAIEAESKPVEEPDWPSFLLDLKAKDVTADDIKRAIPIANGKPVAGDFKRWLEANPGQTLDNLTAVILAAKAAPSDMCTDGGEHEPQFNEDTTLLACSKCGVALEEPEFEEQPALPA